MMNDFGMKQLAYVVVVVLAFASCRNAPTSSASLSAPAAAGLTRLDSIQRLVKQCEGEVDLQGGDFKTAKLLLKRYGHLGMAAIPIGGYIIGRGIGSYSTADKDSAYVLFKGLYYRVIRQLNDSLEVKHAGVLKKLEGNITDSEVTDFTKSLDACGLSLEITEGMYYIDERYDYLYRMFKGKVSEALTGFLAIRSREIKQGFSEDAGLLISFADLYKRVVVWENFMAAYPTFFGADEAHYYYQSYLSTLLTGMDNTPAFDYETQQLLPELKTLYEGVISRNDSKESTRVIALYYERLKARQLTRPDNMEGFLNDNGLYSMMGVQPDTR